MRAGVIVAGGVGKRFGGRIPKQYFSLDGKEILRYSIEAFLPAVDELVVVIRAEDELHFKQNYPKIPYTFGGERRQDSVRRGLEFLVEKSPKFVLIHDAARPFISADFINSIFSELEGGESGVLPTSPIHETVKYAENGYIHRTLDRTKLFKAQTPQGFDFKEILALHKKYQALDFTDDSALFEHAGKKVKNIAGLFQNIKITVPQDVC